MAGRRAKASAPEDKAATLRRAVKAAHDIGVQFPVHKQPLVEAAIDRALRDESRWRYAAPQYDVGGDAN